MKRYGSVIGIRPEHIAEYKRIHAAVWPDVLKQIKASKISNYSIFLKEPENIMFAYFEYEPTLYAELATKVAWLHDIYVDPAVRGQGIGSALIDGVRDAAKELGADKVLLSVAIQNALGRRLFERNGFETTMHEMMLGIDN